MICRRAIDQYKELVARRPMVARYRAELANTRIKLSWVLEALNLAFEADQVRRTALRDWDQLHLGGSAAEPYKSMVSAVLPEAIRAGEPAANRDGNTVRDAGQVKGDLLFAYLGLQNEMLNTGDLLDAMAAWFSDETRTLGQISRDLGHINESKQNLLNELVGEVHRLGSWRRAVDERATGIQGDLVQRLAGDRNLMFGVLALQSGLISRETLIAGVLEWMSDTIRLLGQVLVDRDTLSPAELDLIDGLSPGTSAGRMAQVIFPVCLCSKEMQRRLARRWRALRRR